jgi:serine protease Do
MKDFGEVAEYLRRATIQILGGSVPRPVGSGIIWNTTGVILTNAHVVSGSGAQIELWNRERLWARTISHDRRRDLAALQVAASGLSCVLIGDSTAVRPGELAVAVGNPLGFVGAVSTGVIHAVGPLTGFGDRPWVQTSVRLAPGNSGGPLANARGEVIGVNTMIARAGVEGHISLAIPSATAMHFVSNSSGSGFTLGVTVRPVALRPENGIGLLVLETQPGSAADQAALMVGDVLVAANGQPFRTVYDLEEAIGSSAAGVLTIDFRRGANSHRRRTTAQLRQRKAAAA